MTRSADVLVVAAHAVELQALVRELRRQPNLGCQCTTATVGVGIASAGSGTARLLQEHAPSCVVMLGSAGVYPGRFAFVPGELAITARIELTDSAQVAGRAQVPGAMTTRATTSAALTNAVSEAANVVRRVVVANTVSITTDDALAKELATAGCDVENLEALPVALACEAADVPFTALLGITNVVGAQGRTQWQTHHRNAAESTARALLRWLATRAQK